MATLHSDLVNLSPTAAGAVVGRRRALAEALKNR